MAASPWFPASCHTTGIQREEIFFEDGDCALYLGRLADGSVCAWTKVCNYVQIILVPFDGIDLLQAGALAHSNNKD